MNTNDGKTAFLINKFGEKEILHSTRRGWTRKQRSTTILSLNKPIGKLIGQRIKSFRIKRGYSLADLCTRAGIVSTVPKSRMWEIENCIRSEAMRMGTLYALAIALDVRVVDILPTVKEVVEILDVKMEEIGRITTKNIISDLSNPANSVG